MDFLLHLVGYGSLFVLCIILGLMIVSYIDTKKQKSVPLGILKAFRRD